MASFIDRLHPLVLNVGLAVHNADWNWKNVNSPFHRLYYITEGTAQVVMLQTTLDLKPDHLYFIPAFTTHGYVCDSRFVHYYIHIYEEYESNILDQWDFPFELEAGGIDRMLFARLAQINPHMKLLSSNPDTYDNNPTLEQELRKNRQRALCDKVESRGIVYQLLSRLFKFARPKVVTKDERIVQAVDHIQRHIFETIELETMVRRSCLSKDHFIRLFRKETGLTPQKYIIRKKVERAQLMLVTQETTVKNVALALGYDDVSYFCRLFKKVTGCQPHNYRRSNVV